MHNTSPWRGAGLTDVGRVRSTNQDAFTVQNHLGLWIVADGMGGHAGGDIASRLAVETMVAHFNTAAHDSPHGSAARSTSLLREAVALGDHAIRSEGLTHPELNGMGTTVVALHLIPGPSPSIAVAHVGDSRAYLLHNGAITQLTRDHSLMEDYLNRRMISEEEALTHPQRHVITRALGIEGQAEPDLSIHALQPDDIILLCTDGLTKMVDDQEILDMMTRCDGSSEAICRILVDAANERGGKDNVTAVVICQPRMDDRQAPAARPA